MISIKTRRLRARLRGGVAAPEARHAHDSETAGYKAKAEPGSEAYQQKVALPIMNAIDQMPADLRLCVHEFG